MCSQHETYTHYEHIKVHVRHTLKNNSSLLLQVANACFKTFMNKVSRTEKEEEERKIILKKFIRTYEIHSSLKTINAHYTCKYTWKFKTVFTTR